MKRKAPGTPSVGSPAKKPKKSLQSSTVSAEATPSPEFSAQCANLRQIVDAAKNQLDGGKDISDVRNQGIVSLSKLFNVFRAKVNQVNVDQLKTQQAMNDSDKAMLRLQNLQYEEHNLQQKINEARNSPVSADVDLVSTEEFISKAPAHLKVLAGENEHMKQLAHLQFEVMHRAQLAQDLKSMQRQVSSVSKEISSCERQHEAVSTELRQLLEVAKVFEKKTCFSRSPPSHSLQSPSSSSPSSSTTPTATSTVDSGNTSSAEGARANGGKTEGSGGQPLQDSIHHRVFGDDLLPEPLFVILKKAQVQLAQSSDNASQGLLSVRVEKDCAVGSLANGASLIGQTRATCSEMPDADDIDFVTAHPYSCVVSLVAKGVAEPVQLQFFYHPTMMLVSVDHTLPSTASSSSSSSLCGKAMMDGHATSLLDRITTTMAGAGDHGDGDGHDEHVHDNDAGLACPRLLPACYAQKFSSKIPGLIEAGALGRLYKWAQQLAGLEYLSVQKPKHTQDSSDRPSCTWPQLVQLLS